MISSSRSNNLPVKINLATPPKPITGAIITKRALARPFIRPPPLINNISSNIAQTVATPTPTPEQRAQVEVPKKRGCNCGRKRVLN